jgi:cobalt-zinc-cadmium efflux system outer membrane protein
LAVCVNTPSPPGAIALHRDVWRACAALALILALSDAARAQSSVTEAASPLPSPLRIEQLVELATLKRAELQAARSRKSAAEQRTIVVAALDDPMVMPSLDHLPFMLHGADASFVVEQRFPLSRLLRNRERSAQADARGLGADVKRVGLDVVLEAVSAYWMLYEQRAMLQVIREQLGLARILVSAAASRYGAGTAIQPDVLRAEIEVARLQGAERAVAALVRSAEAMLNMSFARAADAPVPELAQEPLAAEPPPFPWLLEHALARRPELVAGQEEIRHAEAEVEVMRSMIRPMAFARAGPAYTMANGWGFMAMVGMSVPIFRHKNRAIVAEARNMTDMARADLNAMRNMLQGTVAKTRQDVLAARARALALRDDVLPRSRVAADAVLAAYSAGTVPMVSTLDAARALWNAQQEQVMAEVELGVAWARLARAIGGFEAETP